MQRWAWRMINLAAVLALCVVLLGGWTRISDAGLSCPDWPGCYGHMVLPNHAETLDRAQQAFPETPIEHHKTKLEMGHRYLAGSLGMVILALALIGFRMRNVHGYPVKESYLLLGLVILQALFGMWTVTLKLYPPVVTLHLLGGVLTLTLILYLRVRIRQMQDSVSRLQPRVTRLLPLATGVLILQIILGGWTSSNYAGPACQHWLSCNPQSEIAPDFITGFNPVAVIGPNYQGGLLPVEARAAIQIGHRLGALFVVISCLLLIRRLYRHKEFRTVLLLLPVLLAGQMTLGALNAIHAVPDNLAIMHHGLAIVLLLLLLWIYSRLSFAAKENPHA